MASSYKYFADHDRVVTLNELTEIVENNSGSALINGSNAWLSQSYAPSYFTQYAARYQEQTAWALGTKVFDITVGRSSVTTGTSTDLAAQKSIYNQFAKTLLGYDKDGQIQKFNLDPDDTVSGNKILHNAFFINLKRAQFKDKVKQGSFKLHFDVTGGKRVILTDSGSSGTDVRECVTGEYGKLFATGSNTTDVSNLSTANQSVQGLVFYEAGIAVVSPYIFSQIGTESNPSSTNADLNKNVLGLLPAAINVSGSSTLVTALSGTNAQIAYGVATHLMTASYHSTTELNSAIYFCRAYNHEFNYSSNPTYLVDSEIYVKDGKPESQPLAYITTVGLYSEDNQLLAVAKLSEPIKKTPENELIARVRLDF